MNLPATVDWTPNRPFDQSIPMASGTDINVTILTSGTAPYNESTYTTGIIITVPSSNTYQPVSLVYAIDEPRLDGTPSPVISNSTYNLAIGMDLPNEQAYLMYSGTGISGVNAIPITGNEYIINPSGMQSGVAIKVGDVLFAGDQYQLNFYDTPRYVADRFGGIYNLTLNFDCYAETTIEVQELTDFVERFLVEKKFDLYNLAGINWTATSMGGQTEQAHVNEYIFQCSISVECFNEWFDIRSNVLVSNIKNGIVPVGTYWTNVPEMMSGTTLFSSQSITSVDYLTTSGTASMSLNISPSTDIFNIYSGASLSSSTYPLSASGTNGAGWYQSGTTIFFTNGSYSNFQQAADANQIPASGSNFYLTFVNTVLVDPNGKYNIPNGPYVAPGVTTEDNGINSVFDQGPFETISGISIY